jgi:hypothetical protein
VERQTYTITFDSVSVADANRYASELRNILLDATPDVEVERTREDPRAQDFGATLLLALGTSAVPAIVKAMGDWLSLHHKVGITIKTAEGEIIATNLTSKDAMKLADRLLPPK